MRIARLQYKTDQCFLVHGMTKVMCMTSETLRNCYFVRFCVKSKMNNQIIFKMLLKCSSLFQLQICVRPNLLQLLQPKQCLTSDGRQKPAWDHSCLPLSKTLKKRLKMYNNVTLLPDIFIKSILFILLYNNLMILMKKLNSHFFLNLSCNTTNNDLHNQHTDILGSSISFEDTEESYNPDV